MPGQGTEGGGDGSNGANGWKWAEMAATRMPLGCTEGVDWGLKGVDGWFSVAFMKNNQSTDFVAVMSISKKAHRTHVEGRQKGGCWN